MKGNGLLLIIPMIFLLCVLPVQAGTPNWNAVRTIQWNGDFAFIDLNTSAYSLGDSLADIEFTSNNVCTITCRQKVIDAVTVSADNYNCIGIIDADLYQLSNGCNNVQYDYSDISTISNATNYVCIRNYEKQLLSRVNVSFSLVSQFDCNYTLKHYETSDMIISYISRTPAHPVPTNDLTYDWDTGVNATIKYVHMDYPDGITYDARFLQGTLVDQTYTVDGADFNQNGLYTYNITSCQGNSSTNVSTWTNCARCSGNFNTLTNVSSGQTCINADSFTLTYINPPTTPPVLNDTTLPTGAGNDIGNLFTGLGITATVGLYVFSFILALIITIIILIYTKKEIFAFFVFLGLLGMFSIMGWFPFWYLIVLIIIAAMYIVSQIRNGMTGQGKG